MTPARKLALLVTGIALTIFSCNKTTNTVTSTTPKVTNAQLAKQLALQLKGELLGLKGVTANGISTSTVTKGHLAGDAGNGIYGCGSVINIPVTTAFTDLWTAPFKYPDDTVKTVGGNYYFTILCDSARINGYNDFDSIRATGISPYYTFNNYAALNLTVKATDAQYSNYTLDGYIKGDFFDTPFDSSDKNIIYYDHGTTSFVFSGVQFVVTNDLADPYTGSATFNMSQTYHYPGRAGLVTGNYYGTFTFTGNYGLTVTFLQTGKPDVYYFQLDKLSFY